MTVAVVTSSLFEPLDNNPPYEIVRPFVYASAQPKPKKAMRLAMALEPARDFLERFAPDIVHAQGTVLPVIERFLYRGLRAVTVCTVHDARAHERRPWLGSFSGFYGGFDWLICHSESTRQKVRDALPDARIEVVQRGGQGRVEAVRHDLDAPDHRAARPGRRAPGTAAAH